MKKIGQSAGMLRELRYGPPCAQRHCLSANSSAREPSYVGGQLAWPRAGGRFGGSLHGESSSHPGGDKLHPYVAVARS